MKKIWLFCLISAVVMTIGTLPLGAEDHDSNGMVTLTLFGGTGSKLLASCQCLVRYANGEKLSLQESSDANACAAYIEGVVDTLNVVDKQMDASPHFCTPKQATSHQLARIVAKYLNDHPADLHYPAAVLVPKAIMEAFPCKASSGGQN